MNSFDPSWRLRLAEGQPSLSTSNDTFPLLAWTFQYSEIWVLLCLLVGTYLFFCRRRQTGDNLHHNEGPVSYAEGHSASKEKLQKKPVISLAVNQIILDFSATKGISVIEESTAAFLQLCSFTELYLVATVSNDAEVEAILEKLKQLGVEEKGLKLHRIMFSASSAGRGSMIRQLRPLLHIDSEESVVQALTGRIPQSVLLRIEVTGASSHISSKSSWASLQDCVDTIAAISKIDRSCWD